MNLLITINRGVDAKPHECGACPFHGVDIGTFGEGPVSHLCMMPLDGWEGVDAERARHAACLEAERTARLHALDTQPHPVVAVPTLLVPLDRCAACGWPLAASREEGCVPGDCGWRGTSNGFGPSNPRDPERYAREVAASLHGRCAECVCFGVPDCSCPAKDVTP